MATPTCPTQLCWQVVRAPGGRAVGAPRAHAGGGRGRPDRQGHVLGEGAVGVDEVPSPHAPHLGVMRGPQVWNDPRNVGGRNSQARDLRFMLPLMNDLDLRLENVFCKGPSNKQSQHCGPCCLRHNHSTPPLQPQTYVNERAWLCSKKTLCMDTDLNFI